MRKVVFLYIIFFHSIVAFTQSKNEKTPDTLSYNLSAGFYQNEIKLVLSSLIPGGKIYYSTDGSTPSSKNKRFRDTIIIKETTVIRAVLYVNGKVKQRINNTYLINTNHKLPVVSISTNPDNLWGEDKGIYIKGCCASEFAPYKGANFWNNREVKSHFEFFDESKKRKVNQDLGVRIFGGFTRSLDQKSLALIARSKYGKKKINYPFFKTKPELKKFKSVVLRNSGGDFNKSNFRDGLMTHLASETGLITQAFQPVVVYLNGEYWGIQNLREKINEHFIESNFNVDKDSIDIMRHRYDVQHGSSKKYHELLKWLKKNDFKSNEKINELNTKMDIDNYLTYHVAQMYFDNQDMSGNVRYWRKKGDNNRWSWLLFDTDLSFSISSSKGYKTNTLEQFTTYSEEKWPNPHWSTFIIRKLLENDSIRNVYILKTLDNLNTQFSSKNVNLKIDSISKLIESEIEDHSKRWSRKPKYWYRTLDVMKAFADNRPRYFIKHLQQKFNLKDTCVVSIKNNPDFGVVKFNSINNIGQFKGLYLKGLEYKIEVKPKPGYVFLGWKDNKEINNIIKPEGDLYLVAEYQRKGYSEIRNKLIINELNLKSYEKNPDWVELYNNGENQIDLNNWSIHTSKGVDTISNLVIKPNEHLTLYQNKDFRFNISAKSDSVKIYDNNGLLVDAFYINNKQKLKEVHYALRSPFHSRHEKESWTLNYKSKTPSGVNTFYQEMINTENTQTNTLNILGGVLLVLGLGFLVIGRKNNPQKQPENEK